MDNSTLDAINQGSAAVAGAAQTIQAGKSDRRTREWAEKENQKNRDWEKEFYDYTYDRTSPANTMSRLAAAGVNLNSAASYGNNTFAPTSGSGSSISPSYRSYSDMPNTGVILSNMQYQQELTRSQQIENEYKGQSLMLDNEQKQNALRMFDVDFEKNLTNLDLDKQNLDILRQSAESLVSKNAADAKSSWANLQNICQQYQVLKQQVNEIKARTKNYEQDTRYKSLIGDLQEMENNFKSTLYEQGVNPDSKGVDRLVDYLLQTDGGQKTIQRITDWLNNAFSSESNPHPNSFNPFNPNHRKRSNSGVR